MVTIICIICAVIEGILILGLLFQIYRERKSRKLIMKKAELIVKGKLDVEDIKLEGQDSGSAVMASAFNSIKSNLMTFVEATKGNVVVLSDAMDVLSKSVNANQVGNEQIAESVCSVAEKSGEQLDLVKANLALIESNNEQMNEIEKAMSRIQRVLNETVSVSQNGLTNLESYEHDVDIISEDLAKINLILANFNADIKKIEEVGDFIIDISDQLRLLAFNASIEAARVGQAGKGFAVVASEMNDMSVKTKEGMDTINQIVQEIIHSSTLVNDSIVNCENTFNESRNTFEEVNTSFRAINENASNIHEGMNGIAEKITVIAQNSDVSKNQASELYNASVSISESTHEIAAISEETAAESSQLGENVESLGSMLTGIQNLLRQFSTAVVPVEKDRAKKVKIYAFSMLDNDFWYGLRRGIYYAQKELATRNAEVLYFPLGLNGVDLDEQVRELVETAIADEADAICLPGFLGGANPQLMSAIRKGITVIAINCDFGPEIKRMACFSSNEQEAGVLAAKATEKYLSKGGTIGLIRGDQTVGSYVLREKKFEQYFSSKKNIRIVDKKEVLDNAEDAYKKSMAMLRENPDLDVIYTVTGTPLSVVKAIEDSGRRGKTKVVCFDHSPEIYEAVKKGLIAAAVGQDAFGQGHDPIIWAYNNIVTGIPLPNEQMTCRMSVVDKDNVDTLVK